MMMKEADVVIVGTGVAGLFCALHLPEGLRAAIITKDAPENSDSYLAQGGICTLRGAADYRSYFEDTMRAGRYENNSQSVEVMIRSSPVVIEELLKLGVRFDRVGGALSYTREGAHSANRILHHKDETGKEIMETLLARVRERENLTLCPYTEMIDILTEGNRCTGIVVQTARGELGTIAARAVVWATGGLGGLFEHSTNFPHISGDAFGIALRHHIALQDMNYIQIHPTTLYSKRPGRRFLISEAVRGEGATLLNAKHERFVDELQPRDVVSAAILEQMKKYHTEYVSLSMRHMKEEQIRERFPNIYARCMEEGCNPAIDLIPVTPAQHYLMGGVKVGLNGETSMDGLYAVGEASCSGVHGANRLASNSLLESLVFAGRAAHTLASAVAAVPLRRTEPDLSRYAQTERMKADCREAVRREINKRSVKVYAAWCNHAG